MNFGKKLNIKLEQGESLNKKRYNGSFSLDDLKKKVNSLKCMIVYKIHIKIQNYF